MIVRLTGGLGNQLFMYAFGRSIANVRCEPVAFHWSRSTWDYALDPFHLPIELQEPTAGELFSPYNEKSFSWNPDVLRAPKGSYFKGYWQSEKYFNIDLLRKDFDWWVTYPISTRFMDRAFIHVRRGDYLNRGTKEFHGTPSLDYYQAAIDYIRQRVPAVTFDVFTDDPDMKEFMGYPVISSGNQHLDLYRLTKYSHGIGANSTYSWWANWLGDYSGRISIFPKKWFKDEAINTSDLIPERWVRL
jgi:hypothetical protein